MASEHSYNTRQQSKSLASQPSGPLHLIRVQRPLSVGESLAAGSTQGQHVFLEAVGMLTTEVTVLEDVLTSNEAEVFCVALSHKRMNDVGLTDPFFTPEQWALVQQKRRTLLDSASKVGKGLMEALPQEAKAW